MTKGIRKTFFLALFALIVTSGAFAEGFSLGMSGSLYMSEEELDNSSAGDIWAQYEEGEGVYYGINAEILFEKWAVGLYTYFSVYNEYLYDSKYSEEHKFEMVDADVNLSLSYHILGTTEVLDPFVEAGAGVISKNISTASYSSDGGVTYTTYYGDDESEEAFPIQASQYGFVGLGLGLNLGDLGLFSKVQWHLNPEPVTYEEDELPDSYTGDTNSYTPPQFDISELKVALGAKILF